MKKLLSLFSVLLLVTLLFFVPQKAYAAFPSDFPGAAAGEITTFTQGGVSINLHVALDDFSTYQSQFNNSDCYNDYGLSFELYDANSGDLISSQYGERMCYGLGTDAVLFFPPLQVPSGDYFIHYLGSDSSEWITDVFEYTAAAPVHDRPSTGVAIASPIVLASNFTTYPDPAVVTLSPSAASSYTVANTYYKLDGGSTETYSTPFNVEGSGTHTMEYWSVDNTGLEEYDTQVSNVRSRSRGSND